MSNAESLPFELLPGEETLLSARPHPLAMASLVAFWFTLAALGAAQVFFHEELVDLVRRTLSWEFLPDSFVGFVAGHAHDVAWFGVLIPLLVLVAVFRINFGYVLTLIGLIIGNVVLQWKVAPRLDVAPGEHAHLENWLLVAVGGLGIVACEIYRRGHRYFLTSKRIVARFGSLKVSERSTLYSKIDDLILQRGVLGRLFGFGTVIPVTSTGLGMGQDMALAGASVGAGGEAGPVGAGAGLFAAGGKVKNVPRELSMYVLYRIRRPEAARNAILQEMEARERPRRE